MARAWPDGAWAPEERLLGGTMSGQAGGSATPLVEPMVGRHPQHHRASRIPSNVPGQGEVRDENWPLQGGGAHGAVP